MTSIRRFGAPTGSGAVLAAIVTVVLYVGIGVGGPLLAVWIMLRSGDSAVSGHVQNMAVVAGVFAAAWALTCFGGRSLMPRGFSVGDGMLVVERRWLPVRIPLASITRVEPLDRRALGRRTPLTIGACAGLFGTWALGFAWTDSRHGRLGLFRWYGRGQHEKVFVEAGGKRYILEPDTPEEFARAVDEARRERPPPSGNSAKEHCGNVETLVH